MNNFSEKVALISTVTGRYDRVPHLIAPQRYAAHTAKQVYRTDLAKTLTWAF